MTVTNGMKRESPMDHAASTAGAPFVPPAWSALPRAISDAEGVAFLQRSLPRLAMRWPGFRKVPRQFLRQFRQRLVENGVPDLAAYRKLLSADANHAERDRLDRCCRISISRFYRDRNVLDYLGQALLPRLALIPDHPKLGIDRRVPPVASPSPPSPGGRNHGEPTRCSA
jgi:hypothetical protein